MSYTYKKDWEKGPLIKADPNWYKNSSQTEYAVEGGIYGRKPKKVSPISFSKDTTVFQADSNNSSLC